MELDFEVPTLDTLAENIRGLYKAKDDGTGFTLAVKGGLTSKAKLDEFRNKNIELAQEMAKYKDIDPAKYQGLLDQARQLEEGELIKKGDFEGLVAKRIQNVVADKDKTIKEKDDELGLTKQMLESITINDAVKSAAMALGVLPTAVDDVVLRARTTFHVEKGKTVAKDRDGQPLFASDGVTPLSVQDWAKGLKTTAPHLFQGVQGSGGGGGGNRGQGDTSKLSSVDKISLGLSAQK